MAMACGHDSMALLRRRCLHVTGCALLASMIAGCVSMQREPIAADSAAFDRGVEPIFVMPVLDVRLDRKEDFTAADDLKLRQVIMGRLEALGYHVRLADMWLKAGELDAAAFSDMRAADLCRHIPSEAKSAMVIQLVGIRDRYQVIASGCDVSATFALIDRKAGSAVWKDAAIGEQADGGLLASGLAQVGKRAVCYGALAANALASFPAKDR